MNLSTTELYLLEIVYANHKIKNDCQKIGQKLNKSKKYAHNLVSALISKGYLKRDGDNIVINDLQDFTPILCNTIKDKYIEGLEQVLINKHVLDKPMIEKLRQSFFDEMIESMI